MFKMYRVYLKIFSDLELKVNVSVSNDRSMGGKYSFEFFLPHREGEGRYYPSIGSIGGIAYDYADSGDGNFINGIELAHIFYLGDAYAKAID